MSRLFQPLTLRELTLPNRVIVSPMCQYSATDGNAGPWHDVHYGQLYMGSAGMLITEATAVEAIGRITPACLGLYTDEHERLLAAMLERTRSLNDNGSTPICVQLAHAGRKSSSHLPWQSGQQIAPDDGGWETISSSSLPHGKDELPPREMTAQDMADLTETFVRACQRAEAAGFDAIELHCAHGYLLHQFLSPVANQRSDDYGGSLENRMRFPLAVFKAMRDVWPAGKPLGVRISASDWDENSSWDLSESIVFCQALESLGCDWIDASSGGVSANQKIDLKPGYQVPFASAIREQVNMPVMAVGLINEPAHAEQIVADGDADMIALARPFLYNPRWVWHAAAELGGTVAAPSPYWRCVPAGTGRIFGDTPIGMR